MVLPCNFNADKQVTLQFSLIIVNTAGEVAFAKPQYNCMHCSAILHIKDLVCRTSAMRHFATEEHLTRTVKGDTQFHNGVTKFTWIWVSGDAHIYGVCKFLWQSTDDMLDRNCIDSTLIGISRMWLRNWWYGPTLSLCLPLPLLSLINFYLTQHSPIIVCNPV